MNTSVSEVGLKKPYQNSKYSSKNVHDGVPLQLNLLKQDFDIFLEHFQLFQSSHSVDRMQITPSDL